MKTAGTELSAYELEQRIVGAILNRGDAVYDLPAGFSATVLQDHVMRRAFDGIERLARAKKLPSGPVDRTLLAAESGLTDGERELLVVAELNADSVSFRFQGFTIRDDARALLDRHRRVKTKAMLVGAIEALESGAAVEDIAAGVTANLLDVEQHERPEVISYRDAATETLEVMEGVKRGKSPVLRTGFTRIDKVLRIRPGNLIVVGARSKVGKTTWARQVADTVALRGEHVLFHSLEMSVPEVLTLDASRELSIDSTEFFDERPWSNDQWGEVMGAFAKRSPEGTNGFLHANHYHHSLGAILRITEKTHRKLLAQNGRGLVLVVVDYLQLVELQLGKNANREQVVATIARSLKNLAMRLQVPIIALAQLNRDAAKRGEMIRRPHRKPKAKPKRIDPMAPLPGVEPPPQEPEQPETPPEDEPSPPPQLHDLRESGALEQDANAVCFIHHPFDLSTNEIKREHGPFSFIIAAQRLGPKGTIKLYAERNYSRFNEVD